MQRLLTINLPHLRIKDIVKYKEDRVKVVEVGRHNRL